MFAKDKGGKNNYGRLEDDKFDGKSKIDKQDTKKSELEPN